MMPAEITPHEIMLVFWRHKKKFVACLLMMVVASLTATALMRPRFRSEALLFVRLGRENVALDATASIGAGSVVAVPQFREDEINSVVEMLQSRALAEKIVDEFGIDPILGRTAPAAASDSGNSKAGPSAKAGFSASGALSAPESLDDYWQRINPLRQVDPREKAIERVQDRLQVWSPNKTNVIGVAYDGPSPQLAQAIVKRLVDLYLEQHALLHRTPEARSFFTEQAADSRRQLEKSEERLRDLKNQTGMAAVTDQRLILVQRIGRLEDDLLKNRAELAAYEAELKTLAEKLDKLPETRVVQRVSGMPNQAADGMRQQLYALQLKEQELLTTFHEDTRQVREIRRQIQEARGILAKEEYDRTQATNAADPTHAKLHLALHSKQALAASLRSKAQTIESQLADARTSLSTLNDHEMQLTQLERDVQLQEGSYLRYASNLEQARIDQALKLERISNISVAQPATFSPRRTRPDPLLNLGLGLLAGLVAGGCLVLGSEYLERVGNRQTGGERRLALAGMVTMAELKPSHAGKSPRVRHDAAST